MSRSVSVQVCMMINGLGSRSVKECRERATTTCTTETMCSAKRCQSTSGLIVMRGALLEAHVSDKYTDTLSARVQFGNDHFDDIRPTGGSAVDAKGTTARSVPNERGDVDRRKRILGIIVRMQTPVRWIA